VCRGFVCGGGEGRAAGVGGGGGDLQGHEKVIARGKREFPVRRKGGVSLLVDSNPNFEEIGSLERNRRMGDPKREPFRGSRASTSDRGKKGAFPREDRRSLIVGGGIFLVKKEFPFQTGATCTTGGRRPLSYKEGP